MEKLNETLKNTRFALHELFDMAFELNMTGKGTDFSRKLTDVMPEILQDMAAAGNMLSEYEETEMTPEAYAYAIRKFANESKKKANENVPALHGYLSPCKVSDKIVFTRMLDGDTIPLRYEARVEGVEITKAGTFINAVVKEKKAIKYARFAATDFNPDITPAELLVTLVAKKSKESEEEETTANVA